MFSASLSGRWPARHEVLAIRELQSAHPLRPLLKGLLTALLRLQRRSIRALFDGGERRSVGVLSFYYYLVLKGKQRRDAWNNVLPDRLCPDFARLRGSAVTEKVVLYIIVEMTCCFVMVV